MATNFLWAPLTRQPHCSAREPCSGLCWPSACQLCNPLTFFFARHESGLGTALPFSRCTKSGSYRGFICRSLTVARPVSCDPQRTLVPAVTRSGMRPIHLRSHITRSSCRSTAGSRPRTAGRFTRVAVRVYLNLASCSISAVLNFAGS
jgi:hypothetical protein